MTPEAQRIAIAKACGWDDIRINVDWLPEETSGLLSIPHPTKPGCFKRCINRRKIPDYPNDLNAMHEAEKTLTPDQQDKYQNGLGSLVAGATFEAYNHWSNVGCVFVAHASASQRAEAFLKTLGLWTED